MSLERILGLEERLSQVGTEFSDASVERVNKLISRGHESSQLQYNSYLETPEDWKLFHALNPEWQSLSSTEIKALDSYANGWSQALNRWLRSSEELGAKEKNDLKRHFFQGIRISRSDYSIEELAEEYHENQHWPKMSRSELAVDTEYDGRNFYVAVTKRIKSLANSPEEVSSIRDQIFGTMFQDENGLNTPSSSISTSGKLSSDSTLEERLSVLRDDFSSTAYDRVSILLRRKAEVGKSEYRRYLSNTEDWQLYHALNPEWQGLSPSEIRNVSSEANNFYLSFNRWIAGLERGNRDKDQIRKVLFPNITPRVMLYSPEELTAERHSKPEWIDMSYKELKADKEHGGYNFCQNANRRISRLEKTPQKRAELRERIFGEVQWKAYQTESDWIELIQRVTPHLVGKTRPDFVSDTMGHRIDDQLRRWANTIYTNDPFKSTPESLELINRIIPRAKGYRMYVDHTIEDWKQVYEDQFLGMSQNEMSRNIVPGSGAYVSSLQVWLEKNSATLLGRSILRSRVFNLENYIRATFDSFDEAPKTLSMAENILKPWHMKYQRLTQDRRALAITLFPEIGKTHLEEMMIPGYESKSKFWKRSDVRLRELHAIKLAKGLDGSSLSREEYTRFISEVFAGQGDDETAAYIEASDFSRVATTEERVANSKNPNFRLRMFLATNPKLEANQTLESFVKLYSSEEERNHDLAVTNEMAELGLYPIGIAKAVELRSVKIESAPESATVYTIARNLVDSAGSTAAYAIVTPFVNVQTFADYLNEGETDVLESLKEFNAAANRFHTVASENCEVNEPVSYLRSFANSVASEGSNLFALYKSIGETLDAYLEDNVSVIHGDMHAWNTLVSGEGEIFFTDFETVCKGLVQEDLAACYINKDLDLSLEDEMAAVEDYARNQRGLSGDELDEFKNIYHLSLFQKGIEICNFYSGRMNNFTDESEFLETRDYFLSRALEHALEGGVDPERVDAISRECKDKFAYLEERKAA